MLLTSRQHAARLTPRIRQSERKTTLGSVVAGSSVTFPPAPPPMLALRWTESDTHLSDTALALSNAAV